MLDTTVLIAGMGWPRWPYEVLLAGVRGQYRLVLCPYVIEQARRVLLRRFPLVLDHFDSWLSHTTFEQAQDPTPEQLSAREGLLRDITDLPVLLAALNAGVDYLVSEDKDLTEAAIVSPGPRIILPGTFLREVLGWDQERLQQVHKRNWQDLAERP